jgi:phosphoglycolate phosphatase
MLRDRFALAPRKDGPNVMYHDDRPELHPRAVIFDCDGTLVNSYPAITASVNHVRSLHRLAPLPEAEVRRCVGRGADYLLEHTVPGAPAAAALAAYKAHHPSVLRSGTTLLPGVAEALSALHSSGLRLGVCSNKPRPFTTKLLDYLDVAGVFDVVLGPEDVARLKPAPDLLVTALSRLGVAPSEALYVGDMSVDIATARAAGVAVWVVPTGSEDQAALIAARPDRLLGDFRELMALIPRHGLDRK